MHGVPLMRTLRMLALSPVKTPMQPWLEKCRRWKSELDDAGPALTVEAKVEASSDIAITELGVEGVVMAREVWAV